MTARARVDHDFTFDGVAIWLGRTRDGGGMEVMLPADPVMQTQPDVAASNLPSLRLPEDLARALFDALSAYFGGTSDVQTLRKDYLAERARVDKMIDHLTVGVTSWPPRGVTRRPAGTAPEVAPICPLGRREASGVDGGPGTARSR